MCGIVGFIGKENIGEVLLKALSRLEYRGYDSAGIASLDHGMISVYKDSGKLANLVRHVGQISVTGTLGIGHTRWATHGEPCQRNAHPHTDCQKKIAVVHNGIIENYAVLKNRLKSEGHTFESQTDSEVIAHLLEHYHLNQGLPLAEALRKTLSELEGSYAVCAVSAEEPDLFVAARNGSPLAVGLGEGRNIVASDAPAILDYTREVIFLEDYQIVTVTRDDVRVTDRSGEAVDPVITEIDWDIRDVSKDSYPHFMLKEIEEQPRVLERLVRTRFQAGLEETLFDAVRFEKDKLRDTDRILIQACGTSWHAALTAKYLFENIAGIPTEVDVSSEFRYRHLIPRPDTLLLSITQSGETIDTLMGVRHAREKGFKTLSICNVLGSTIARESDAVIYTHAGPEIGVASTKAYTAQLGIILCLGLYWLKQHRGIPCGPVCVNRPAQAREGISPDFAGGGSIVAGRQNDRACCLQPVHDYDALVEELAGIPEKMGQIIEEKKKIQKIAQKYHMSRDFLFLGRGIHYPNAHEGALKIKEIAYIHATGHPAGEMKHGPIALIDDNMPVVCIAPRSAVYDKMFSNMQEVKARRGRVIAIATDGDEDIKRFADDVIYIPAAHEFVMPLLVALPLQYLAYFTAVYRGTDVDQPRNLAKSVTVE